jgi:hypothetical protein
MKKIALVTGILVPTNPDAITPGTLQRSARRTLAFIDAVESHPHILEALEPIGLTRAELEEVKTIARAERSRGRPRVPTPPHVTAMKECEAFLGSTFGYAYNKLDLRYPEQRDAVFHGLEADAKGTEAAIMVDVFVERCRLLADSPDRKATRETDRAALAALAEVGLDAKRLDAIGRTASIAFAGAPVGETGRVATPTPEEERDANLRRVYHWHAVWSAQARQVITRREDLIRLGIASRRNKKAKPAPAASVPVPAPAPEASPPAPPVSLVPPVPLRAPLAAVPTAKPTVATTDEAGPDSRAA